MKWTQEIIKSGDVEYLSTRYNLDPILSTIFAERGILEADKIKFFLTPEPSMLHNPFLFENMTDFCDRINAAIEDKEKVCIFGDRDVDGITSTVLMKTELERLGLDVIYTLPMNDEPYGMSIEGIDKAHEKGCTLFVSVDCGVSNIEEIAYANTLGIDTLVVDHHLGSETLPEATCIINPKLENSGYPFAHLAACGVVAKCIWALRFSQTQMYQETVILLHSEKKNNVIILEAVKLENLVPVSRVVEQVVAKQTNASDSKIISYLGCNCPILVLDADYERDLIKEAFSQKIDINLYDLRDQFEKYIPVVKNATLFKLSQVSKVARYLKQKSELDTLISMFTAYVRIKYPILGKQYEQILDLTALGTIADLMPLEDENRVLVRFGLSMIQKAVRPSMTSFLNKLNLLGKTLNSQDIGWNMAPCINAAGRMGDPSIACELFLCTDTAKAELLADQLVHLNKQRQHLSEVTWDKILPKAKDSYEMFGSKFVIVQDKSIVRGIAGIMANRLMKHFNAPAIVITTTGDGMYSGSMRSFGQMNTRDFLNKYATLFSDFGGHKYAGGFSIEEKNVNELLMQISEDLDYMDCPEEVDENIIIDATVPADLFTPELIKTVELFEPYGESNPPLTFLIKKARIDSAEILKAQKGTNNHLKLNISHGQYIWPAVYWFAANKLTDEFSVGDIVNVAFKLGKNSYKNQETLQLTICGIERTSV